MRILINDYDQQIIVAKDLEGMDPALIGQTIAELELIKNDLLELYEYDD